MEEEVPLNLIRRLADLGKQAGLSCDQMILLLRSGLTVEKLVELIEAGFIKPIQAEPEHRLM
jgi:hypothetical protein